MWRQLVFIWFGTLNFGVDLISFHILIQEHWKKQRGCLDHQGGTSIFGGRKLPKCWPATSPEHLQMGRLCSHEIIFAYCRLNNNHNFKVWWTKIIFTDLWCYYLEISKYLWFLLVIKPLIVPKLLRFAAETGWNFSLLLYSVFLRDFAIPLTKCKVYFPTLGFEL